MPMNPTPGQVRGKDPTDAANLDAHDDAKRLRAKHRSKYGPRACPTHYQDPDGLRECKETEAAVETTGQEVRNYRSELIAASGEPDDE